MGCVGRIKNLFELRQTDFIIETELIREMNVIFFNNFGPWFTAVTPGKDTDFCSVFCNQVSFNSYIITFIC